MNMKVDSNRLTSTQPTLDTKSAATPAPVTVETTTKPADAYANDTRPAADDGALRAEAPTAQVFTGPERAELSKKIPCPALASMFNAGTLKAEKDGTVKIPDLNNALTQLGINGTVRGLLTHGADATDPAKGQFNLFNLNGSNLDHTGSSGIRQNGIHEERFELMKSFSKDGKTLTPHDLSEAATKFAKDSPGFKGGVIQLAELAILLETFGQRDAKGKPYFTFEDAKSLFVDGQIPKSWNPPAVPGTVTMVDVLKLAAAMKLDQIF